MKPKLPVAFGDIWRASREIAVEKLENPYEVILRCFAVIGPILCGISQQTAIADPPDCEEPSTEFG
jgi:hypothetical protein